MAQPKASLPGGGKHRSILERFEQQVSEHYVGDFKGFLQEDDSKVATKICHLDWSQGLDPLPKSQIETVAELGRLQDTKCDLRVIVAPLDLPRETENYRGLKKLVELFDIPHTFLAERLCGIPYSFGASLNDSGTQKIWMHLMIKSLPREREPWEKYNTKEEAEGTPWVKSAFYMTWIRDRKSDNESINRKGNDIGKGKSKCSPTGSPRPSPVTLICFSPLLSLQARWETAWEQKDTEALGRRLENPCLFLTDIFDIWHRYVDGNVWTGNGRGAHLENQTAAEAGVWMAPLAPGAAAYDHNKIDLQKLYRLLQTTIYLKEGIDAATQVIALALDFYEATQRPPLEDDDSAASSAANPRYTDPVISELRYRKEMFGGTLLRLMSLRYRLETINSISYSLASLKDNRVVQSLSAETVRISDEMKRHSQQMAVLSTLGVFLLPTSVLAAVFEAVHTPSAPALNLGRNLGVLLLLCIPATIGIGYYVSSGGKLGDAWKRRWDVWVSDLADLVRPHLQV